jgi:lysozyme
MLQWLKATNSNPAPRLQPGAQRNTAIAGTIAAAIALAVPVVAQYEGYSGKAYFDVAHVKTICYGATAADGIDFGRTYTKAECQQILGEKDLPKYAAMAQSCTKVPVPLHRAVAIISFTYNLGQGSYCHGIAPYFNRGDVAGGCHAMLGYVNARVGGVLRPVAALVTRRKGEYALCVRSD